MNSESDVALFSLFFFFSSTNVDASLLLIWKSNQNICHNRQNCKKKSVWGEASGKDDRGWVHAGAVTTK